MALIPTFSITDIQAALNQQTTTLMSYACDCGEYSCWMFLAKMECYQQFVY